ncbi:glycosyltransferase family 4 protein [Actinosynnema sp. NPDC050801]|uniref:glycosyltransferase family 4 protein n=1 Tax=unclassified Actinosynnema TaxID=2637065 RepID=UPI0033D91635
MLREALHGMGNVGKSHLPMGHAHRNRTNPRVESGMPASLFPNRTATSAQEQRVTTTRHQPTTPVVESQPRRGEDRTTGTPPVAGVPEHDERAARAVPAEARSVLIILILCDEWFPGKGGISSFNRYLCRALAAAGHRVLCLVPSATPVEEGDAEANGVRLITARQQGGVTDSEALMRKPDLPDGVVPDVVIGHARITGPAARVLVESCYPTARRLHFVHMHPDQIVWGKPDREDDAALTSEERTRQERDLCVGAARTIAVGPKLHDYALSKLTYSLRVPNAVQIVPGFDDVDVRRPSRDGTPIVTVVGRVADAYNKGVDLAAMAIGHSILRLNVPEHRLDFLVRGVPAGEGDDMRGWILKWSGVPGLTVSMRNYASNPQDVIDDLDMTSLLLMPSREEGFGLSAWEAMRLGIAARVSARSGCGWLLSAALPDDLARNVVLPVHKDDARDVELWASHINAVMMNPQAAFDTAWKVRNVLAERYTWADAVKVVETALQPG